MVNELDSFVYWGAELVVGVPHCCVFVGFKFRVTSPLQVLHGILSPADSKTVNNGALEEDTRSETMPVSDGKSVVSGITN